MFTVIAIVLGALATMLYSARLSAASDHQDSPLAVDRAGADTTDLFVFPAADPKNVVLVMDIHALIPRTMGDLFVFDPGVMYQFKIATDGGAMENKVSSSARSEWHQISASRFTDLRLQR